MANETKTSGVSHEKIETNNFLMIVLILLVLLVGGMVEIVPLFFQKSTTEPITGIQPYTPLQLAGRDVYLREGCYNCHSQMIRPFRAETLRYGHYSVAGESVYDHPFQWGSKRTESNMPAYPWLEKSLVDAESLPSHMRALRTVGVPYTDEQIAKASEEVKGKTELEATIAYLQSLGLALK
jgi:cytochrome c oxidase cbb3-type subunit 2